MSTFKMRDVVMLPTKKAENCLILLSILKLEYHKQYFTKEYLQHIYAKAFHLYFLSQGEIKEGDWVLWSHGNSLQQVKELNVHNNTVEFKDERYSGYLSSCKKIIATTDSSLTHEIFIEGMPAQVPLPKPTQSFLEVFVKEYNKGNQIEKVMVEYENDYEQVVPMGALCGQKLKIKKDNTITIREVKSSWSREEVIELFNKLEQERSRYYPEDARDIVPLDSWIEQNL